MKASVWIPLDIRHDLVLLGGIAEYYRALSGETMDIGKYVGGCLGDSGGEGDREMMSVCNCV